MATKKAATNQELDDLFAQIGTGDGDSSPAPNEASGAQKPPASADADDEVFADIKSQLTVPSRTSTPQAPSSAASTKKYTPTSSHSGRSSEEKPPARSSAELQSSAAPAAGSQRTSDDSTKASKSNAGGGGGWWGGLSGLSSFATSAVKQAQGAVEQLQKNEDAQKWMEQAKDNYGLLRGLGADLGSKALPTFTNILHTLAPPISQHERLQIHITHDIVGYPTLDPLIYQSFARVMAQVEGGDLLVIQRGSESGQRRASEVGFSGSSTVGWADGPWWQAGSAKRSLNAVHGLVEGTKLARASTEGYSHEFYSAQDGLEAAMKQATTVLSESNPTRTSDVFVCIQPIAYTNQPELFAASKDSKEQTEGEGVVKDESQSADELVGFAIHLHDPIHSIAFSSLSQALPQKWIDWMDAEVTMSEQDGAQVPVLPEEVQDVIARGGVDPREWIAEWMEELLSSSVGIVAQRYVARRMGVGEGAIGRGKRREEPVDSGGGEAARAT
ncbi:MAG: hypothetical protein Q9162_003796 [Coniocarpon cinnabarinum]